MTAKTVVFGNFKGGAGKTTNTTMIGYTLAKKGFKVLVLDQDPQANASSLYLKTTARKNSEIIVNKTLMAAIAEGNLSQIITEIDENLFLLPSYADYTSYPLFLENKFPQDMNARTHYLKELLHPLKEKFDFILIDVPPTVSIYTDSALIASDYSVIVLQTQERSLVGAEAYVKYLQELIDNYNADFDVLGVLPVLLKNNSAVDQNILDTAKEKFGVENLFQTVIKNMERLKRYDMIGIVSKEEAKADIHDQRLHTLYNDVTNEFLVRMDKLEKGKEAELYEQSTT